MMMDADGTEIVVLILPAASLLRKAAARSIELEDGRFECHFPVTYAGGGSEEVYEEVGMRSSDEFPEIPRLGRDGKFLTTEEVRQMGTTSEGTSSEIPRRIDNSITALDTVSKELHDRLAVVMGPSSKVEEAANEPPVSGHSAYTDRLSEIHSRLTEILERLEV